MKKQLYFACILFIVSSFIIRLNAQMLYIPDSMFRVKLTNLGYGSCITGDSIDSSCPLIANVQTLNLYSASIRNLQGIQAFPVLFTLDCDHNPGITFPAIPSTVTSFSCSDDSLTYLPVLPNSLRSLGCSNNYISTINTLPDSLRICNLNLNNLSSLPSLPLNLDALQIDGNNISTILSLPSNLTYLTCESNNLSALPILPAGLTYLDIGANNFSTLPSLPSSLQELHFNVNHVSNIPSLPAGLIKLTGNINQLTGLPSLPSTLDDLAVSFNLISTLPQLPATLIRLWCDNNQLTSLPSLPNGLWFGDVSNNQISNLPSLPASIGQFNCSYNPLDSLPSLPTGLIDFRCNNCSLTTIPDLPNSVSVFLCQKNNLLSSIGELPDSMYQFDCSFNPSLHCLPRIKTIYNFNFDSTGISCLPGYGNLYFCTPSLGTVPLCDVFNINNCNFFWNIGGKTFSDPDTNCLQSGIEPGLNNIHLMLYENGNIVQQAFTGTEGFYSFDVNSFGSYMVEVDTAGLPFTSVCPITNQYTDSITPVDSLSNSNDFALDCKTGFDLGAWSVISSNCIPGRLSTVTIHAGDLANFYGVHCASGVSGSLQITIIGNVQYLGPVAGAVTPSSIIGNTITYSISDWSLFNSQTDFSFEIKTDTNAIPGSLVCFNVSILPVIGDNNVSNNMLTNCFTVHSSFDPNDKEVYPEGVIDTSQHWLTYTIHFQNTGTASADNIYILDSLNNNIDFSSFQLLATSHPAYVQILNGGIAKFNFPHINLPDSNANEPMSHGFVQYKVKLKDNLVIGTQIHNTAYIYFDFNAPVVTNTTLNTIDVSNGLFEHDAVSLFRVWPVPFSNYFMIQSESIAANARFSIVNLIGKEILKGDLNSGFLKINTEIWTSGIYFLKIENLNGVSTHKLIKK